MINIALRKINKKIVFEDINFPLVKDGFSIIKVKYMGICRTDIDVVENSFKIDNITLGHEVSGSIYQSNVFEVNQYVGINPYTEDGMRGLTEDGYFANFISVPNEKIYPIENKLLATYLEPISASLLDIELKQPLAVYGYGRIPSMLQKILQLNGLDCDLIFDGERKYETVVYSSYGNLNNAMKSLYNKGTIILRARNHQDESFDSFTFIKKELTMKSSYGVSFDKAVHFINNNEDFLMDYMGDVFDIRDYKRAFDTSKSSDKKIFMRF